MGLIPKEKKQNEKKIPTGVAGVSYLPSKRHGKSDKCYYIKYNLPKHLVPLGANRQRMNAVGRESSGMTVFLAGEIREDREKGKNLPEDKPKTVKVEVGETPSAGETWTFDSLWDEWKKVNAEKAGLYRDDTRYHKHLKGTFGHLTPGEVQPLDVDRLKSRMVKKYADDTILSVVSLLRRIANFGPDNKLCPGLSFTIKIKKLGLTPQNRTETLTREQRILLKRKCRQEKNRQVGALAELILETGIRKGSAIKLLRSDVNLEGRYIRLRKLKSGKDETNRISLKAIAVLRNHEKHYDPRSKHVFSGRDNGRLSERGLRDGLERLRVEANLPDIDGKPFRPLHGLRHAFASKMASEGKPQYHIQRLLNHSTPAMMQRYAHLSDEALDKTLNS